MIAIAAKKQGVTREEWLDILVERALRDIPAHIDKRTNGRVNFDGIAFQVKGSDEEMFSFGFDEYILLEDALRYLPQGYSKILIKQMLKRTDFLDVKIQRKKKRTQQGEEEKKVKVEELIKGVGLLYLLTYPDARERNQEERETALGLKQGEFDQIFHAKTAMKNCYPRRGYETKENAFETLHMHMWRCIKEHRDKEQKKERGTKTDEQDPRYIRTGFRNFEEMYVALYNSVLQFLRQKVRHSSEIEDMTQNAFLRADKFIEQYNPFDSFKSWFFRVAINQMINYQRTIRKTIVSQDLIEEWTRMQNGEGVQEERIDQERNAREVRLIIEKLPPLYRRVIELFYWSDLSYPEISQELQIPLGTVMSRLHRAKRRVKEYGIEFERI